MQTETTFLGKMKTINMYYLQAGVESKNIVSLSVALRKKCLDGNPRFAKLSRIPQRPTLLCL